MRPDKRVANGCAAGIYSANLRHSDEKYWLRGLLGLASGGACSSRRMTLGEAGWIGSARSSRIVLSYQMDAAILTAISAMLTPR
jgi:hypothetical protein